MGQAAAGLHAVQDWFGPPWKTPEVVLLLHGIAESSRAWAAWVPHLAGRFRVVRLDLPGFGKSPAADDQDWTPARLAADVARALDALGIGAVHFVAAKYGGTIGFQFAADYPERTRTLSVLSGPVKVRGVGTADIPSFAARIRRDGVRAWAAATQRTRLGSKAPAAQIEWWNDELMGRADAAACIAATAAAADLDVSAALPRIKAPTLVVTTDGSALQPVEMVRADQQRIANSKLLVLAGDSYHIAAVEPDLCARHVLEFIDANR